MDKYQDLWIMMHIIPEEICENIKNDNLNILWKLNDDKLFIVILNARKYHPARRHMNFWAFLAMRTLHKT